MSTPLRLCCCAPRTLICLANSPLPRRAAFFFGACRAVAPRLAVTQHVLQGPTGIRLGRECHLFRRAFGDDSPAGVPTFRPQIDNPVRRLDHFQIVFDDEHRVAGVHEVVQHLQQQFDIGEMQSRGRFVQQIKRLSGALLDQLASQLDALGFAAGQRGRGLTQLDVVESHIVEGLQFVAYLRDVLEQLQQLLDIHFENLGDGLLLELHLQRFAVVAVTFADGTGHPHVGQKVHFEPIGTVPLAGFATPARDVETEAARLMTAPAGFGQLREQGANVVEDLDVRAGIGARRAADRRLVDGDQFVEFAETFDSLMPARLSFAAVEISPQGLHQYVIHERALARTGDTRDADELAQRNTDVDAFEVVVCGADDRECLAAAGPPNRRNFDRFPAGKETCR